MYFGKGIYLVFNEFEHILDYLCLNPPAPQLISLFIITNEFCVFSKNFIVTPFQVHQIGRICDKLTAHVGETFAEDFDSFQM